MRYNIGLSAPQFDPDGAGVVCILPESISGLFGGQRRQTRTATLDGGVSFYDTGYTVSDNTWRVRVPYSEPARLLIEHLSLTYQKIYVSVVSGYFEVSLSNWSRDGKDLIINLAVIREAT